MIKINLLAVLMAIILPMNLQAEVITQWNFDGGDLSAMNGGRGSATDISFGSTWSAVNDQLERNTASSPNNTFNRLTTTPANQFGFTFTVSGLAAYEVLDIESASFDYAEPGVTLNTVRYVWFANDTAITGQQDSVPPESRLDTFSTNLSLITNLANGDSVFIEYGSRDNVSSGIISVDNLVLNGTVRATAVPEPSSLMLLGLGAVGIAVRRRRNR